MTARETRLEIQRLLGVKQDGIFGPVTKSAYESLGALDGPLVWPATKNDVAATQEPGKGIREINQDALGLIKHFEGLYLAAYKDPVGILTIGYGHTGLTHKDGTVFEGRKITKEEAESLLKRDLEVFGKRVEDSITVPLNDNEFGALVSFDFNTGGLPGSTLRQKLNAGDRTGAANEFLRWNKAGGQVLSGLTRRRKSERNLFLSQKPYIEIA